MRVPSLVKVAGVVVLGICSSQLVSVFMAHGRLRAASAAQSPVDEALQDEDRKAVSNDEGGAPALPAVADVGDLPARCLARLSIDQLSVVAVGNQIVASASATILEKRKGASYVWSIVAINQASGNVAHEFLYRNQIFSLLPPASASPTFKEAFEVAPGSYLVELRLYSVPSGFDVERLMNKEVAASQLAVANSREVTVW